MKEQKYLLFLLSLAVILRLYCIILPSFHGDMSSFEAWAGRLVDVGPAHFYTEGYFADYFPGYLYILLFLGKSFTLLFHGNTIYGLDFEHYLKYLTNVFDFGTAFLLFKIVSKKSWPWGMAAAFLYLINPALTFNSSIWGQVDGILTFFLVAAAYALIELKNLPLWGILSGVALLVKPQGISAVTLLGVHFLKTVKPNKYYFGLLVPVATILLALPFFPNDPIFGLFHLALKSANVYPYTSMFSYNFWSIAGFWKPDSTRFLVFSYQTWGYIIFSIIFLFILIPFLKKSLHKKPDLLYLALSLGIFAFFLFLTRIHQRYLFYFFPFLLVFALMRRNLYYILIYLALSLIHFANLWFVYYYYNYVFNSPGFADLPTYQLLNNNYNIFTFLNLALFFTLLVIYYILAFKHEAKT